MMRPAANVTRIRPPPPHLAAEGSALWRAVVRDYSVDSDVALAHLQVAAEALDRLAECRETIKAEGLTIRGKDGVPIANPLLKIENAARASFQSAMRALRLRPTIHGGYA
jgi:P27 family predicted phage terminase small subunit